LKWYIKCAQQIPGDSVGGRHSNVIEFQSVSVLDVEPILQISPPQSNVYFVSRDNIFVGNIFKMWKLLEGIFIKTVILLIQSND
jgi:hypothetical protein